MSHFGAKLFMVDKLNYNGTEPDRNSNSNPRHAKNSRARGGVKGFLDKVDAGRPQIGAMGGR